MTMTTWLLLAALAVPAADAPPNTEPNNVPVTRVESKEVLEGHKAAKPRLPMPPADPDNPKSKVNNGWIRTHYLSHLGTGGQTVAFSSEPDPVLTLDNTFKVKLFWVTSRTNNCLYCLGHQEYKLSSAGQSDDQIAALEGDWKEFSEAERTALRFTVKFSTSPHEVTPADLDGLKKHYTPNQVSEMVVAVAGYSSINRWTGALNIPGESTGKYFAKPGAKDEFTTFKTPTSEKYAGRTSSVAPLTKGENKSCKPAAVPRPKLETRGEVEAAWKVAATRKPQLPMADGTDANWERLLNVFAKSSASRIAGLKVAAEKGDLSSKLKAEIAWATAREDRAWYALDLAKRRLKNAGMTDDQIFALDGDTKELPEKDRLALALARKITVAPALVTDADVEGLRKHFADREVAEIVHHACNAAFFNRVTEAAGLPLDK